MAPRFCICVFAKPPLPGKAKTRLIPSLGEAGAALLAEALLRDTLDSIRKIDWFSAVLATTEESPKLESLGIRVWLQGDGDLGQKLERILQRALEHNEVAIAIGADSPGLPAPFLVRARELIQTHDAVLGPCTDGGFYLLALKSCPTGLLVGIPWSGSRTFQCTLARLRLHGLTVALLDPWFDIDRPEDLKQLADYFLVDAVTAPRTAKVLFELLPSAPKVVR